MNLYQREHELYNHHLNLPIVEQKQLTKAEAIEQGYKYWQYEDSDFGPLFDITDFPSSDKRETDIPVLCYLEPTCPSITAKRLIDIIWDDVYDNMEVQDMEDTVADAIK